MTNKVKFYTLYEPPKSEALEVPETDYCIEATEQTHAQSDINILVRRYNLGDMSAMSGVDRPPVFGDFRGAATYEDSKQAVLDAEREFMKLPAELRDRFENNPGKLLAFLEDRNNLDEAIRLGLCVAPAGYKSPDERAAEAAERAVQKPAPSVSE